jgi:hypothetical protein
MARLLVLTAVLILIGASYAASCSSRSYSEACSRCSFDAGGKMDPECRSNSEGDAKSCLVITYPKTSAAYNDGKCPEVDRCVADLEICKTTKSSGSDKTDCSNNDYKACFLQADDCVKYAAQKCAKETDSTIFNLPSYCGGGGPALIGFLLVGSLVFSSRKSA